MRNRFIEYVVIFFLLALLFVQLVFSVLQESPTYDEVTYLQAGYAFLYKDFRWDPFNPPFAREIIALPLLINKSFITDPVVLWPRMIVVLFTIMLGLLTYFFAKKLYGITAGVFSLVLFTFEPNLLAHGHYATMDLIFSFFFLLTIFMFWSYFGTFTKRRTIIFGIIFGLTLSVKISALSFLVVSLFLYFLFHVIREKRSLFKIFFAKQKWFFLLFLAVTCLSVWSTYFFTFEPVLGYRFDSQRPAIAIAQKNPFVHYMLTVPVPLGSYISTVKQILLYNYSSLYTKNSFFMGELSHDGLPGYYFIPLLLLKTPIPLVFLFVFSLYYFRKQLPKSAIILLPIAGILLNVLFAKVTLVLRYILPIYPLMIIFASQSIISYPKNKKITFGLTGCLVLWLVSGTFSYFPHYISYSNEIIGNKNFAYRYIADSNLDWGQGLYSLRDYQKKNNINSLQLAYFGVVEPELYGVRYERIKDMNLYDKKNIQKLDTSGDKIIAISVMCYYFCGYSTDPRLRKMELYDTISGSILLFKKI